MNFFDRYGFAEVCDLYVMAIADDTPALGRTFDKDETILFLDTLKMTNISGEGQEKVIKGGKGDPELLSFDFGRAVTMEVEDALASFEMMSVIMGGSYNAATGTIHTYERLTLDQSKKASVTNTIASGSLKVFDEDGTAQAVTTDYTLSNKEITGVTLSASDVIVVEYDYAVAANGGTFTLESSDFPGTYKFIGDTLITNQSTGLNEVLQVVIPKGKIQPAFDFKFQSDGDATVFNFKIKVLRNDDGTMIKLIKAGTAA